MRTIFTIFLLTGLTIGAVFLFRVSLTQTLIEVDIEELARYSQAEKDKKNTAFEKSLPTVTQKTPVVKEPGKIPPPQKAVPTFDEEIIIEAQKEINTPPPLKKAISLVKNGTLTVPGVLSATNAERATSEAAPLALSDQLSSAAAAKVQDMFDQQYFEHIGPDGKQPSDWVDASGYEYKLTGENLALGDFSGDMDLVTAWMNSPGHRANMLKPEFTQIGIAVGKGMFEGQETWLAVQVFGKPMPNCASVDIELKSYIDENQDALEAMNANLQTKQQEINSAENTFGAEYKKQVDAYNTLVAEYNNLIGRTEILVEQYNLSVQMFNTCMAQ